MGSSNRFKFMESKTAPGETAEITDRQELLEQPKPEVDARDEKRHPIQIDETPPPLPPLPPEIKNVQTEPSKLASPKTYIKKDLEIKIVEYRKFLGSLNEWKSSVQTMRSATRDLAHPQRDSIYELEEDSVKEKKTEIAKMYLPIDQTLRQLIVDIDHYFHTMSEHTREIPKHDIVVLENGPLLRIYLNINSAVSDLKLGLPNTCWSRLFQSHPGFAAIKLLDRIQIELAQIFPRIHDLAIEARFGSVKPGHRVIADTH